MSLQIMDSLKSNYNFANKLILGTAQMGLDYGINNHKGKISQKESLSILKVAYNSGIRILDTAEAYGDAHQLIGNYHKNKIILNLKLSLNFRIILNIIY